MSSFKQKLKTLLIDSSSFKNPINNEEKFGQTMIKIYRKVKSYNNIQSKLLNTNYKIYSSKNKNSQINKYFPEKSDYISKNKKGISPKTAINMIEALSLLKNYNSRNCNKDPFYEKMNKYLNDNSKTNQKIQRDLYYFKINNSNYNYRRCNRPKSYFNNRNNNNKNKQIYNLKQSCPGNVIDLINKEDNLLYYNNENNIKKENYNFIDSFNEYSKMRKKDYFNFSRNKSNKYLSKTNYNYNFNF